MKRITLLLLVFLGLTTSIFAQWEIGIGGLGVGPVDRFQGSLYKNGGGLFINLTTKSFLSDNQPWELRFGLYMDGVDAGRKSFDTKLSDPPDAEGEIEFANCQIGHHLITRLGYQVTPKITVFMDGIVGHRKFHSETLTGLKEYKEEYKTDVEKIFVARTFRYGVGMGSRIGLTKSFGLEIRADYTRGGQVTYFDLKSIVESDDAFLYESQTWKHSDLFMVSLSANWKLFKIEPGTSTNSSTPNNTYTPSYRTTPSRTTTPTTPKKKTVTPTKPIQKKEEKKEEKINW